MSRNCHIWAHSFLLEAVMSLCYIIIIIMNAISFDTPKYAKQLEDGGVPRNQAEAQATVYKNSINEIMLGFVSKEDVVILKKDSDTYRTDIISIKNDIIVMKSDIVVMKSDIATLKSDVAILKSDVASIKVNLAVMMWMQGLIMLTVVVPAVKELLGL